MTRDDLFEAMSGLEERQIQEATQYKKRRPLLIGVAAACLCLVGVILWYYLVPGWRIVFPPVSDESLDPDSQQPPIISVAPPPPPAKPLPEGMDPLTGEIADFPASHRLEEVDRATLEELTETQARAVEGLSHRLPDRLPEGYAFVGGELSETVMKDGTAYRKLRVDYREAEPVAEQSPEGSPAPPSAPAGFFWVTVTDFAPRTDLPAYRPEELTPAFWSVYNRFGEDILLVSEDCWITVSGVLTEKQLPTVIGDILE